MKTKPFSLRRVRSQLARRGSSAAMISLSLLASGTALAQGAPALRFEAQHSSDSDDFDLTRFRLGGLHRYDNPWSYAGVSVQTTRYAQPGWQTRAQGITGIFRDVDRNTLAGVDIDAGVTRAAGRLRFIGDAAWRTRVAETTSLDLLVSGDLVETPLALARGIAHTLYAANLEHDITPRLTATGLAGWQHFTDGNARTHLRGRLIWSAFPDQGVTLQARYRQYDSRQSDVGGAYYNPDRYQQWLGVVALRRRDGAWQSSAALGAGQQRASGSGTTASYLAEGRVEGPLIGNARLVLRAQYERAAGFIDSPHYTYRGVSASVIWPFN